jgi:hypothetical protein
LQSKITKNAEFVEFKLHFYMKNNSIQAFCNFEFIDAAFLVKTLYNIKIL